jgi:MFS family permease
MACWWMASNFVVYYSIYALFATHLQKDLNLSPGLVATPLALANLVDFLAMGWWGWVADRLGRRWSMIIPAALAHHKPGVRPSEGLWTRGQRCSREAEANRKRLQ